MFGGSFGAAKEKVSDGNYRKILKVTADSCWKLQNPGASELKE